MGRHLASPFPLLMVRTSHPREQPERKDAIRIGTPLPVAPTPPRLSREKTLNCERQAQVRARRGALQCPLTADMGPNETMQRDQELDRINGIPRPLSPSPQRPTFRISHLPNDPKQVDVPREPAPLQIPAFLHPAFVSIATGSAAPMQTGCPGLTHNP
ncbi:hypothetical protein BJV77DRAFT_63673 [Russula vinacea]|nr:hypothetical protein BJV77DRAFT_63673 [Russula vinacea]